MRTETDWIGIMRKSAMIVAPVALGATFAFGAPAAQAASTACDAAHHCVTHTGTNGGAWYMNDKVFLSKTTLSSGPYKYKYTVSRTPNRPITTLVNGTLRTFTHTAYVFRYYRNGKVVKTVNNPPTTLTYYSNTATDDVVVGFKVNGVATKAVVASF